MNVHSLLILAAIGCSSLFSLAESDFLRFKNGDTLHGRYLGLDEGPLIKWLSEEAEEPINFDTQNLQKLSLNKGRAKKQLSSKGLVELANGDLVPGDLISMNGDSVSLQTQFAGLLTIPRNQIVKIQPNRFGGDVLYAGPFNEEEWRSPQSQKEIAEEKGEEEKEEKQQLEGELPSVWTYGASAWYSNSTQALRLEKELPDRVSIRFKLSWQAPLNVNLAVLADFQRPHRELKGPAPRVRRVDEGEDENPEKEKLAEEEEPIAFADIMEIGTGTAHSDIYGTGYLISVLSSYSRLQRLDFDEKLNGKKVSFPNSGGRLNLGDFYSAEFEVRADRTKGTLSLFVNGEFFSEWQDLAEPLSDTQRYFAISAGGKTRVRLSDVVVSEWNGMPDSARSMKVEERDVMLLTNGTDRFSGKILSLEEGAFSVESDYGVFQIPANEVSDIHFASGSVEPAPDPETGEVLVSLQPNGILTVFPKEGLANSLQSNHAILGDLTLDLTYAYLLEFDPIGTIFDNWDDEF